MSKKLCIPVFSTVKGKLLFIRQNFLYNPSEKQNRLEEQEQSNMNIGTQILKIRKEKGLTRRNLEKYFMLPDRLCLIGRMKRASRSWKNKFVRFDQIVGKAVVRYYPSFK